MKTALVLVIALFFFTHAEAQVPETKQGNWDSGWSQLLSDVVAKGEPFANQILAAFHFQYGTSFDTNLDRQVSYFTLSGKVDSAGRFAAAEVSTVSETWTQLGPNWNIEQCVKVADLSGKLRKIMARNIVLDPSRKVLSMESKKVRSVEDPIEVVAWKSAIQFWMNQGQELPNTNPEVVLNSRCHVE